MVVRRSWRKITNNGTRLSCHIRKNQVGKQVQQSNTNFMSLPKELLVDVLAKVASSSFDHLFNVKLSCKEFTKVAEDDYIFEHVSIDKFPVILWQNPVNEKKVSFLTRCFNKGNSEAVFRLGMIEYFTLSKVETGLEYLKSAMEKKNVKATYMYGMLLLAQGDQHGLNVLNTIKRSKQHNWNIVEECRDKIRSILESLWKFNKIKMDKVNTKCENQDHATRFRRRRWRFDDDEELASCETCLWYQELVYFGAMMNLNV